MAGLELAGMRTGGGLSASDFRAQVAPEAWLPIVEPDGTVVAVPYEALLDVELVDGGGRVLWHR